MWLKRVQNWIGLLTSFASLFPKRIFEEFVRLLDSRNFVRRKEGLIIVTGWC